MIGGPTGIRVGPKGEPGYPGGPGSKGERGPPGKNSHNTSYTILIMHFHGSYFDMEAEL